MTTAPPRRNPSALVVGAGFGGIAAAVELRKRGVDLVVLEKAERVGGVWRDNTYPGAACDVPSSLYSYSFAPHAGWPRRYAGQADILDYIDASSPSTTSGTPRHRHRGRRATWDEATRPLDACTRAEAVRGTVVRRGRAGHRGGAAVRPSVPDLPGIDSFAGPAFHSAEWDHEVDLSGKRVAVVGTGASAIQFVPHLQQEAAQVTVFQRSAPYVVPKPDRAYTRLHHRAFTRAPSTQGFGRELTRNLSELLNMALAEQTVVTKASSRPSTCTCATR